MAFIIAVSVWLYVYAEHGPRFQTTVAVPVKYVGVETGYYLADAPEKALVRLTGDPKAVAAVTPDKLSATVNLAGMGEGERRAPVRLKNSTQADAGRKKYFVRVKIARLKKVKRGVKVGFYGALRSGLVLGKVNYKPRQIYVYGLEKQVARVRLVRGNVDLGPRSESFSEEVSMTALDRDGISVPGVKLSPDTVRVEVGLRNEGMKVAPIALRLRRGSGRPPDSMQMELYPSVVTLQGPEEALADVEYINTKEFDWRRCGEGGIFPVDIEIPADVTSSVAAISLSCSLSGARERRVAVPLAPANLADGLTARLRPTTVEVLLKGDEAALRELKKKDIQAVVDVSGLEPGVHNVAPSVGLRNEIGGIEAYTELDRVEVRIERK